MVAAVLDLGEIILASTAPQQRMQIEGTVMLQHLLLDGDEDVRTVTSVWEAVGAVVVGIGGVLRVPPVLGVGDFLLAMVQVLCRQSGCDE